MKVIKKNTANKATKTTARESAPVKGNTITPENFDGAITYVGRKIPTAVVRKEAVGLVIPKLPTAGFVAITGDKPGVLIHPCNHNGDIYMRVTSEGKRYGSITAINAVGKKRISAELLDVAGLKKLAQKVGKGLTVTRRSDKKEFKVALLRPFGDQYVPGIASVGGKFAVLNMEHPEKWNGKHDQFDPGADIDPKKVLASV